MEIAKSDIVRSDAGRDRGKIFIVLAVEGEYLLLADGKGRKVESPKRKKRRHVLFVAADDSRLSDKIKSEEKILVDFWATWCGPCMRQAPILEELAGEGYHIGKVDVDQAPDLAGTYRVMSIPTLILFKNGEEVKRFIGLQTKDTLKALLDAE